MSSLHGGFKPSYARPKSRVRSTASRSRRLRNSPRYALAKRVFWISPSPRIERCGTRIHRQAKRCLRCNLWLRTASRVLCRLGSFRAGIAEELFYKASRVPWELWLNPEIPIDLRGRRGIFADKQRRQGDRDYPPEHRKMLGAKGFFSFFGRDAESEDVPGDSPPGRSSGKKSSSGSSTITA